jgi:hypothetical protein
MYKVYAVTFELKSSLATIHATVFTVASNLDEAKYLGKLDIQRTYACNDSNHPYRPENVDEIKELSTRPIDGAKATSLTADWRIGIVPLDYIITEG